MDPAAFAALAASGAGKDATDMQWMPTGAGGDLDLDGLQVFVTVMDASAGAGFAASNSA